MICTTYNEYRHVIGIELAQSVFGLRSKQWTLGLPFYGRDVNTGEPKAYYELTEPLALLSVPERTKTDIVESVYFNNYDTLRQKIKLARDRKAGGVMIWELGQDIQPFNRSNSLMKAVRDSTISQSDIPNDDTLSTIGTEGGVIHEEL